MPHVSKHKLDAKSAHTVFKQLCSLIAKSKKSTTPTVLHVLLTETEQIMLAKRLAVIVMLHEGYSSYRIWKTLKMSRSTIMRMKGHFYDGEYDPVCKMIGRSKAEREQLWKTIERITRMGMPSMGKDRWQTLRNR